MDKIFQNAKFITTEFTPYFASSTSPWNKKRTKYYQHNDLVEWNGLPMFVRDFDVDDTKNAKIYFTALGCVEIFINGKRIGKDLFKPGWSDYLKRTLYCEYDVSDVLVKGKNRVLAVLSNGWYTGRIAGCRFGEDAPSLLLAVDNGKNIVSTDDEWLCSVGGQIRTADFYDGEYRDGTYDSYELISTVDYDVSEWKKADIYNGFKGEVTPFIGSKICVRDNLSLKPQNITVFDGIEYNGSDFGKIHVCNADAKLPVHVKRGQKLVVDIGQETVGWLKIKVKGEKNVTLKMRYAEFVNDSGLISRGNDGPEGSVYTINLRSALGKAYYKIGSDKAEIYCPTFTFFGYRYVEISPDGDFELIDVTAEVVGNDNVETGKIETSNELVNKLFSNALWGQRGNYLSVPTDCPQRDERLGWTGDAQAFSVTAAYNADVYGFFRKWMQDMRDSQSEQGGYGDVNPRVGCCSSEDAAGWADAGVIIPYNLFRQFGDKTILEEHFDSMDKYVCGLKDKFGMRGPIPRYGDWLAYDLCEKEFLSSAYFIHDIDLMIFMAGVLGRNERVDFYKDLRVKAHKYFTDNFMKDGKLIGQTQCDKVISLAFDLIEGEYAKQVADALEQQIIENGYRLSTGFLGTYNLCITLSKFGKDKIAYDLLLQRNEPSWLYSVDQGATTIWERWNSYTKEKGFGDVGMNSFNHYAYGSVVEWMYRFMAGIEPAEPGYGKLLLNPRFDLRKSHELPEGQKNITWIKAEYNSVKGLIKSEWEVDDGIVYKCTVPEGIDALLKLPDIGSFTENGENVTPEKIENGFAEFTLSSGEYTFTIK